MLKKKAGKIPNSQNSLNKKSEARATTILNSNYIEIGSLKADTQRNGR